MSQGAIHMISTDIVGSYLVTRPCSQSVAIELTMALANLNVSASRGETQCWGHIFPFLWHGNMEDQVDINWMGSEKALSYIYILYIYILYI